MIELDLTLEGVIEILNSRHRIMVPFEKQSDVAGSCAHLLEVVAKITQNYTTYTSGQRRNLLSQLLIEAYSNVVDAQIREDISGTEIVTITGNFFEDAFLIGIGQQTPYNPRRILGENLFNNAGLGFRKVYPRAPQTIFFDNPADARVMYVYDKDF